MLRDCYSNKRTLEGLRLLSHQLVLVFDLLPGRVDFVLQVLKCCSQVRVIKGGSSGLGTGFPGAPILVHERQ